MIVPFCTEASKWGVAPVCVVHCFKRLSECDMFLFNTLVSVSIIGFEAVARSRAVRRSAQGRGFRAMFGRRYLAAAALLVCLWPQASFGAVTGRISGTVKDPTGAVVPSAEVTALETQTGIRNATRTDAQGFYSFPSLPVGHYELEV